MKRLSSILFFVLSAAAVLAANPEKIDVRVTRVDSSAFPRIIVYFTVLDNVPGSPYYDLESKTPYPTDPDGYRLTVSEARLAPDGETVEDGPVDVGGTFVASNIRPAATCLVVDRSGSMSIVLPYVQKAVRTFVETLPPGDRSALLFFSGMPDCNGMYYHPPTDDVESLKSFVDAYLGDSGGATPLYTAWDLSLGALEDLVNDYPARAVITLTDGVNTSGNPGDYQVVTVSRSLSTPVFNIAFPKIQEVDGVIRMGGNIDATTMKNISNPTDAAYFEPVPPYPTLPSVPDHEGTEEGDEEDPDKMPDDAAAEYYIELLRVLQRIFDKPDDFEVDFEDYKSAINTVLATDCDDKDAFMAVEIDDTVLDYTAIEDKSYKDMNDEAVDISEKVSGSISENLLDNFYNDQMLTMFTKIRQSMRKEYAMAFETPFPQLDGSIRRLDFTIRYTTTSSLATVTLDGSGRGRYVAPAVIEEDTHASQVSRPNPDDPVYDALFGSKVAPRSGTWVDGEVGIRYFIDVLGREDGEDVTWPIGTVAGTDVTRDDDPDNPFLSVPDEELVTFVAALDLEAGFEPSDGKLETHVYARIPTCIVKLDGGASEPTLSSLRGNPLAGGWRRGVAVCYKIRAEAYRTYEYSKKVVVMTGGHPSASTVPGQSATVRLALPEIVVYATDSTPPTVALYACPDREKINSVHLVERDFDSEARPRPYNLLFSGPYWSPDLSSSLDSTLSAELTSQVPLSSWPITLVDDADGNPPPMEQVDGLYFREDERLVIDVLVRDNWDQAYDFSYICVPDGEPVIVPHNYFSDGDRFRKEEDEPEWPFLLDKSKVIGSLATDPHWSGFDADNPRLSGFTVRLMGADERPVSGDLVIRQANYPSGPSRYLRIEASDQSGNTSLLEVPLRILPAGFDARAIEKTARRYH